MEKQTVVRASGKAGLQTGKRNEGLKAAFLIMAVTFVVRAIGSMLFRHFPTLVIDENLYTSLAKDLLEGFSVGYRGQPIDYPYLLYPIFLCPVYLLERLFGGDIYRWIQVFNSLLMASSVIPMYLFAKDFTGDTKKGLICAGLTALMPDGVLTGYLLSESLVWPLASCLLYFSWRAYKNQEKDIRPGTDGVLMAVITFCMFITKPGSITVGAVLCVMLLVAPLRKKQKVLPALIPTLVLAGTIAVWYGIYFLFLNKTTTGVLGLYTKQMDGWTKDNILVMLEAVPMMVLLAVFALCGVFVFYPLCGRKEYSSSQRSFIIPVTLGILFLCVGTAVFVTPYQWYSGAGNIPLHLRYLSMFLPAFFAFTLALPGQGHLKKRGGKTKETAYGFKNNKLFYILLVVFIVLCAFPGVRTGFVVNDNTPADSITLAAFHTTNRSNGELWGTLETIACAAFIIYILFCQYETGRSEKTLRFCVGFIAAMMVLNNICAYANANARFDDTVTEDALEMKQIVKELDEKPMGITQIYYDDIDTYWMETHLDHSMQQVTSQQFFVELYNANNQGAYGTYIPFVPVVQSPNKNNHITYATNTFVLGINVHEHMEFFENSDLTYTKNGHFAVLKTKPGQQVIATAWDGTDGNTMKPDLDGRLYIYDPDRLTCSKLCIEMEASGEGTFKIHDTEIPVSGGTQVYTFTVKPQPYIDLYVTSGEIEVTGYRTYPVDAE